jgi:carboxymethylenebutenolidase
MPETMIAATDGSGRFMAHVVAPKDAPAGAVVLIQEIFGVNAAMRALSDWVADLGFLALCPDLFWRQEHGVQLTDGSEAEWARAFELYKGFDAAKGVEDLKATLAAARAHPACNGRVATMGFCLGGNLAFRMAVESDAECNVSYYGVGLEALLDGVPRIARPLLLHIAGADRFVPPEAQARILAAVSGNRHVAAHVYPGVDHAFSRIGGHSWNGRAAAIANGRTAEFLAAHLG